MTINQLLLENFRCYRKQEFEVSPRTNLVVGPNTSGKTSLLEAIFLLASGTSPRAGVDREMVREGTPFASVFGKIDGPVPADSPTLRVEDPKPEGFSSAGSKELEVQLIARENSPTLTTKKFKVNGVGRRLGDFLPQFHAVLFSPEDLDLVTGSPDRRRRFLNFALSSVNPRYRRALMEYDKVRKRRNRLLEQISKFPSVDLSGLGFWDAKLLEFGTFLQDERKNLFDEINSLLHDSFFIIHYSISDLTVERLQELRPREIAAERTLIGPHRDDFRFAKTRNHADPTERHNAESRGCDLAAFGSRSEQRRAVLALKKAELEFVERKIEERPVLLLDDIFSELDAENRSRVAKEFVDSNQVIITTADIHHIPAELREGSRVIEL